MNPYCLYTHAHSLLHIGSVNYVGRDVGALYIMLSFYYSPVIRTACETIAKEGALNLEVTYKESANIIHGAYEVG